MKYFLKSLRINRPLSLTHHNIIDIPMLKHIASLAKAMKQGAVFKALFLTALFAFLRLCNLCSHSAVSYDPSRQLTGADVFFTKVYIKIMIKWSKTMQTRDSVQILTLPRLTDVDICPRAALKALKKLYPMSDHSSLFQYHGPNGWSPLIDSKARKVLKSINVQLGLNPSHFTVSKDLGPHLRLTLTSPYKTLKGMGLGLLTVSGDTYKLIYPQASTSTRHWLML